MERRDEVIKLREAGLSYRKIGRRLGVSGERVRQIEKGNRKGEKLGLDSKIMLTPSDVAQLLGVHVNTVRRWSQGGILKGYRISQRGDRRFRREDIDDFLKERQIGGEP